eukprot:704591-Rhodomonas_salina.2
MCKQWQRCSALMSCGCAQEDERLHPLGTPHHHIYDLGEVGAPPSACAALFGLRAEQALGPVSAVL